MKNKKPIFTSYAMFCCSTALLILPTICSAEGKIGVGTGFDFSSGDYGETTTTEITYVPVNLRLQTDSYAFKSTIPYVSISSEAGNVVGGGSNVVVLNTDGETSGESTTESGLGDIIFSGTYFLYGGSPEQPLMPMVDLTAKIKFPTADEEKGLGTGELDYSFESDLTWFTGQTALFGTVGYRFTGDPEDYDLNDVMYASAGVAHQVAARLSMGLMYDIREASSDYGSDTSEATAYASYKMSDNMKFLLYGVKGFSDGSPDYGIGFTVSYAVDPSEYDWLAPVRRITNL